MKILTSASVVDWSRMYGQFTRLRDFVGRPRSAATARHSRHTPVSGVLPAASTPYACYTHGTASGVSRLALAVAPVKRDSVGRPRSVATARHSRHTPVSGVLPAASTPYKYRHLQWKMPDADCADKSFRINNAVSV